MPEAPLIVPPKNSSSSDHAREYPVGWGDDDLTRFLITSEENGYATYQRMPDEFKALSRVNDLFKEAVDALHNSEKWFVGVMFIQAHSDYLGAVRLIISGQIPEGFKALRGCLETVFYCFHIDKNAELLEVWLRRDESPESKQKVRDNFQIGAILRELESVAPEHHPPAKKMYEELIDFGAHPNEKALSGRLKQEEGDGFFQFNVNYLNPNPLQLKYGMTTAVRIGLLTLKIFGCVIPERFSISGVRLKVDSMARSY